jgi:glycosyltransferase involved in cell wall biosynthesis
MRILILTNLTVVDQMLSIASVVQDQCTMLVRHGHEVHVAVNSSCGDCDAVARFFGVASSLMFPFELLEYQSPGHAIEHNKVHVQSVCDALWWRVLEYDVVFTHDLVFSAFNLPCAEAIRLLSAETKHVRFYHWVHSVPTVRAEWWDLCRYGDNHSLVYLNDVDVRHVADIWRCDTCRISVIPPACDPRIFWEFSEETWTFIDSLPALMTASFVQIYPASGDRLESKGLRQLLAVFGAVKRAGASVCLVVADSHVTGARKRQDREYYRRIAERHGLTPAEFCFSSDEDHGGHETGLPRRMLRELMLLSDVFVFPSRGESFGKCLYESAMTGVLPVLNVGTDYMLQMREHFGSIPMARFGSFQSTVDDTKCTTSLDSIAGRIIIDVEGSPALRAKRYVRQKLNIDALYRDCYEPILTQTQKAKS